MAPPSESDPNQHPPQSRWAKARANNPDYRLREVERKKRARALARAQKASNVATSNSNTASTTSGDAATRTSTVSDPQAASPTSPTIPAASPSLTPAAKNPLRPEDVIECIAIARKLYWKWTEKWVSASDLHVMLRREWELALQNQEEAEWLYRVQRWIKKSKPVISVLRDVMVLPLPHEHWEIEDAWRQAYDLMEQVHASLAVLRAWEAVSGPQESL